MLNVLVKRLQFLKTYIILLQLFDIFPGQTEVRGGD